MTSTVRLDDLDLSDTHSTAVTADAGNTLGGTLTALVTDPATAAGDGTVTWNYSVANSSTQYLAADISTLSLHDALPIYNHGGFVDQTVTVTVTGTNDNPTISVA